MGIFPSMIGGPSGPTSPQTIDDLFQAEEVGTNAQGQSLAETYEAQGDTAEAGAYTNAASIANANARLATIGGTVEQQQQALQLRQTIGTQQATQAGNGFGAGGSGLAIMRSSNRQGLLEQQLTGVNSELQSAGYAAQGEASTAEASAATAAATAATALSQSEASLSQQAKTTASQIQGPTPAAPPGTADIPHFANF
jgi:hypothetical protein